MTATVDPHAGAVSPAGNPMGFGRMLRKEDARFLRGQGHYLDDLSLPGMLHAAILRSPVAHARITSIDTSAAEAHPKVRAVITGALLETLNLAWMPTLSADVQAVLATDKVRFQGQEVAMVVTTSTDGPTTTSSTGRQATVGGPTRSSPQPTWSSPRRCSTRARTRHRWRPAARSRAWTR